VSRRYHSINRNDYNITVVVMENLVRSGFNGSIPLIRMITTL
jgi:hypothetical protein